MNKEKASVKVSTVAQGQNKLYVGTTVSYCAVQNSGRPDQNGFNALSSNAEPSCQVKHASRGNRKKILCNRLFDQPHFQRANSNAGSKETSNSREQRPSLTVAGGAIVTFITRFTWEPQSVTMQSDTLAGLTNHGFNALSSMFTWESQTETEQTDSLAGLTNHVSTRSIPTQ